MLELYVLVKHLHVSAAMLSLSLFVLRGGWMLRQSQWLQRRWVKVLPHFVDTVLLLSAITLAISLARMNVPLGWLAVKLVAVVGYIIMGTLALKRGRTLRTRLTAFLMALLIFAYIVAVALTKKAWPF